MKRYIKNLSKLENSIEKVANAWCEGNKELIDSMGEDYYFLDENEIGTAMLMDENSINTIKKSLVNSFGNINTNILTSLSKSVASGSYFKTLNEPIPKPISKQEEPSNSIIVMVDNLEKVNAQKEEALYAKAKQTGRGNPLFQKLMPGDLDGKYMGKTGKFLVEYPSDMNVAAILNLKVNEIADFVDEQLGNKDYDGVSQRIFISKELQKEDASVCAVMYHGINGGQNREIALAVREAIRDSVPSSINIDIGGTYSVLSTELDNAKLEYASIDNTTSKYLKSNIGMSIPKDIHLNELLAPTQHEFEQECLSL